MPRILSCALVWFVLISSGLASGGTVVKFSIAQEKLQIDYSCPEVDWERTVFIALRTGSEAGSAVVPFGESVEGSTVFLPFQADRLYFLQMGTDTSKIFKRTWENWKWSDRAEDKDVRLKVGATD